MAQIILTHEELQLVRACITVAKQSVKNFLLTATPREEELIEYSDTDKLYTKFLG